jgi:hypothetical protein
VAPDGQHAAIACSYGLCLVPNLSGQSKRVVLVSGLHLAEIAWSPDGSGLAVVDRDPNRATPVRLVVSTSHGASVLQELAAAEAVAEAPQWPPYGLSNLGQAYPYDGRRIATFEIRSRQVVDLCQAHWDECCALSPARRTVLLNYVRGDFRTSYVMRRPQCGGARRTRLNR